MKSNYFALLGGILGGIAAPFLFGHPFWSLVIAWAAVGISIMIWSLFYSENQEETPQMNEDGPIGNVFSFLFLTVICSIAGAFSILFLGDKQRVEFEQKLGITNLKFRSPIVGFQKPWTFERPAPQPSEPGVLAKPVRKKNKKASGTDLDAMNDRLASLGDK